MKTIVSVCLVLAMCAITPASTHVFWYKAQTNGYNLAQSNPGPGIAPGAVIHEGMIATGCVAQHSGAAESEMVFGSGLDDSQGRCAFIWSYDLCNATGTADSAKVRAEFRDGWCGNACCNAGPINIRCGVADFQGNISTWGTPETVPETADWQDFLNPISSSMGYDFMTSTLQAEEVINWTAPAGRQSDFDPSVLDGKFFDIDITDQVNYILQNSGQLAIMLLVPIGEGSTGKVSSFGRENCPDVSTLTCKGDNPWTPDGNTAHIVVESDNLVVGVEGGAGEATADEVALAQNAPNPFNPETRIGFNTGTAGTGLLLIYNTEGRAVYSERLNGSGTVYWNARNFAAGVYLARLEAGGRVASRRMILVK